jgi:hypothetical protein
MIINVGTLCDLLTAREKVRSVMLMLADAAELDGHTLQPIMELSLQAQELFDRMSTLLDPHVERMRKAESQAEAERAMIDGKENC